MDNVFYLVSAHTSCIEGIRLSIKNKHAYITQDIAGFSADEEDDSAVKNGSDSEQWAAKIGKFLDGQQWSDHAIAFILPAEDVTFRKLTFPFQERKKVEQALPFELEEELMGDLAETAYSVQIQSTTEQHSEALVLLIGRKRLQQLQQLCLERDLIIRNVDCAAHALYRSKIFDNSTTIETRDLFQIYIGSDESFVNTIHEKRLDEIKIFPNQIPVILQKHFSTENLLAAFLQSFAKHPDGVDNADGDSLQNEAFMQLKEELRWLCAQLTLYLRIKNFSSESQIEVYGIFGPMIKWDGLKFSIRSFPLPEAEAFAERSVEDPDFILTSEESVKDGILTISQTDVKAPDTLEELMVEAKQRERSDEKTQTSDDQIKTTPSEEKEENRPSSGVPEPINPQTSLLSLIERKHWGILGELRKKTEIILESHRLSLYYENTPWRRILRRNGVAFAVAATLIIIISAGFVWNTITQQDLLHQEIVRGESLVQTELRQVLPNTSASGVNAMLMELEEKIELRKAYIKNSKSFEKRDYHNLSFLKNISALLSEDTPFQVDSLEYAPERFSISGTIDSYDSLQILKNNLQEIKEFKGRRIVESNRKSPDGIVFRISVDFK